jgi:hypothetical protein
MLCQAPLIAAVGATYGMVVIGSLPKSRRRAVKPQPNSVLELPADVCFPANVAVLLVYI